jgi:hypothetical protein
LAGCNYLKMVQQLTNDLFDNEGKYEVFMDQDVWTHTTLRVEGVDRTDTQKIMR